MIVEAEGGAGLKVDIPVCWRFPGFVKARDAGVFQAMTTAYLFVEEFLYRRMEIRRSLK